MEVRICHDADSLGAAASRKCAQIINRAIGEKGEARIILSTGASQFETLSHLVSEDVDWSKVTMFHLDEYVGLPESHAASFRKYLKDRFISKVNLKACHLVEGRKEQLEELSRLLCGKPIDLGLIGIGENGHIAFNDPPCDFDTQDPYIQKTAGRGRLVCICQRSAGSGGVDVMPPDNEMPQYCKCGAS